jgi:hypothetical protein
MNQRKTLLLFLAVASIIAGAAILLSLPYNGFFWDNLPEAAVGVALLAAGITYFLKNRRP